mgnify:CR=1 FL=1
MEERVLRKLFLGFIQIHILHHAKDHPIFGLWMLEELKEHGYDISAGTLYPILHNMENDGLLVKEEKNVEGKYYSFKIFASVFAVLPPQTQFTGGWTPFPWSVPWVVFV